MQTIISREEIISMLEQLNESNAFKILSYLEDKTDEQGKNALIISLEESLYNKFLIMIKPIPFIDTNTLESHKIFFDPFNCGIFYNTKPLMWNAPVEQKEIINGNYEEFCNTKTDFYSPYSAYAYITRLEDTNLRKNLIEACHTIDFDIIDFIPVKNIPIKDENNQCKLYEENDYIKYVPYPLHTPLKLLNIKNIPVTSWSLNKSGIAAIIIDSSKLSKENQNIIEELKKDTKEETVISEEFGFIHLSTRARKYEPSYIITEHLEDIINKLQEQQYDYEAIPIDELYLSTIRYLSFFGITLPKETTKEEKIKVCKKSNKYLVLNNEETMFYLHPSLKPKNNKKLTKK